MNLINTSGEKFKIIRDGSEVKETLGLRHQKRNKKFIGFQPDEDIRINDVLYRVITEEKFKVTNIEKHVVFGQINQILVYCDLVK